MKTLLVYNTSTGNIVFTKAPVEDEFGCIVADIPQDRQAINVVNGEVVLDDTEEVKAIKRKLAKLEEESCILKQTLLEKELGGLL